MTFRGATTSGAQQLTNPGTAPPSCDAAWLASWHQSRERDDNEQVPLVWAIPLVVGSHLTSWVVAPVNTSIAADGRREAPSRPKLTLAAPVVRSLHALGVASAHAFQSRRSARHAKYRRSAPSSRTRLSEATLLAGSLNAGYAVGCRAGHRRACDCADSQAADRSADRDRSAGKGITGCNQHKPIASTAIAGRR